MAAGVRRTECFCSTAAVKGTTDGSYNKFGRGPCFTVNSGLNGPVNKAVTRVKPYICTMPLKMDEGWNQIQLNLSDLTRRAYGTNYVETLMVQVHENCRLRRIYFSERLYAEEELPPEFKLYLPMQKNFGIFDAGLLELLTHVLIVCVLGMSQLMYFLVASRVVMTTHDLVIE